jgi:hypothetical protein
MSCHRLISGRGAAPRHRGGLFVAAEIIALHMPFSDRPWRVWGRRSITLAFQQFNHRPEIMGYDAGQNAAISSLHTGASPPLHSPLYRGCDLCASPAKIALGLFTFCS